MGKKKKAAEKKSDSKLIYFGSLWKNKSKGGTVYLSGFFGAARILIFTNKGKDESDSDNPPDYNMYIAPPPEKDRDSLTDDGDDELPF